MTSWPAFPEVVRRKRDCGIVTSALAAREPDLKETEVADRLSASQGFLALGERWRSIDLAGARRILLRILARDLAYDTALMSAAEASALTEQWLGLTSPPRSFFTNGSWAEIPTPPRAAGGASWHPISVSTFDAGVIAIDERQVLMLWVQDED